VLHALELADQLSELLAVVPDISGGVGEGAEGQTSHLCRDADAAFVQQADGVFVSLSLFAEEVLVWDLDVVEIEYAG